MITNWVLKIPAYLILLVKFIGIVAVYIIISTIASLCILFATTFLAERYHVCSLVNLSNLVLIYNKVYDRISEDPQSFTVLLGRVFAGSSILTICVMISRGNIDNRVENQANEYKTPNDEEENSEKSKEMRKFSGDSEHIQLEAMLNDIQIYEQMLEETGKMR